MIKENKKHVAVSDRNVRCFSGSLAPNQQTEKKKKQREGMRGGNMT